MNGNLIRVVILGLICLFPLTTVAQPALATAADPRLTGEQLERLVAPVALYPDPLLGQLLMASTYPLDIVKADRWLQKPDNAALHGDELTAAVEPEPWDPSIKSLVAFAQLLRMMDDNLDWTEQLGSAFVAQQADVLDAVQRLRQRAQERGSLASTPEQTVAHDEQTILIRPTRSEIVYIPVYNPQCFYGSGDCPPADAALGFGDGIAWPAAFWAWGIVDFREHRIRIDRDRFRRFHAGRERPNEVWQHDPGHNPSQANGASGIPAAFPATNIARPGLSHGVLVAPAFVAGVHTAGPTVLRGPIGNAGGMHPAPSAAVSMSRGVPAPGQLAHPVPGRAAPVALAPSWHAAPAQTPVYGGHR